MVLQKNRKEYKQDDLLQVNDHGAFGSIPLAHPRTSTLIQISFFPFWGKNRKNLALTRGFRG